MMEKLMTRYKELNLPHDMWFYVPWGVTSPRQVGQPHMIFSYPIELALMVKEHGVQSVLEIGTARGKTGTLMALCGAKVISVDVEQNRQEFAVLAACEMECKGNFEVIRGYSQVVMPLIKDKSFDAVFVDGDHSYEGAYHDIGEALRIARKVVYIHDADNPNCKGVTEAMLKYAQGRGLKHIIVPMEKAADGLGVIYL